MGIILTLIVLVSAFNLVSTLVDDRHGQARRHRHPENLGRQPRSRYQSIFVVQGATRPA